MRIRITPVQKASLQATFAVVIWGATFIATKLALREAAPVTVIWLRFAMGVTLLGWTVLRRRQFSLPAWPHEWGEIVLLGFLGIAFHQWLQANGLVTSQATTTAWIVASIPAFTTLLGVFFLGERLKRLGLPGLVLAGLGVLLVISRGNLAALRPTALVPGDLLILLSAPNWAVFSVLSRRSLQRRPAAWLMFWVMLTGWLLLSLLFVLNGNWREIPAIGPTGWASIFILGVFGSGLAYIAWYDALETLSASRLSVFVYLEPLVTLAVSAFVLSESVTLPVLLGGGMVLLGVWLTGRD